MGNTTLFYPGDEPTPCWTCRHFIGLHTYAPNGHLFGSVTCADRGRFTVGDPDRGCRHWQASPTLRPCSSSPPS